METENLDVVYVLKKAEVNEELRHSLRSICKNLPHRNVYFAGYMPRWVKGVHHIKVDQNAGSKYRNSGNNLKAACRDERVSDNFILMHDDFIVLKKVKKLTWHHKGNLDDVIKIYQNMTATDYLHGMERTRQVLHDLGQHEHGDLKSYELHIPLIFNKRKRLLISQIQGLVNTAWKHVHGNTLYGNFWSMRGTKIPDVKIYTYDKEPAKDAKFVSTTDQAFKLGKVGSFIRREFKEKCRYEL